MTVFHDLFHVLFRERGSRKTSGIPLRDRRFKKKGKVHKSRAEDVVHFTFYFFVLRSRFISRFSRFIS
jgi:hypothetical protein